MHNPESLEEQLLEALVHLHDPDYDPPESIYTLTGCRPQMGLMPLQSALVYAIEGLKPTTTLPSDSRPRRVYDVIHNRFVLRLTQEKTAELMAFSVRHLNRVQHEAIHTLARRLWEHSHDPRHPSPYDPATAETQEKSNADLQAPDWQAQTRRELASLKASSPNATSDVDETIKGVLKLLNALVEEGGSQLEIGYVQANMVAAVNPSALRQVLITAVGRLSRFEHEGPITIFAGLQDGNVRITVTGTPTEGYVPDEVSLVRDILTPENVHVTAKTDSGNVFLSIEVPSARGEVNVLTVDDNADMAHFYRRCTSGTRFHISHVLEGKGLLDLVKRTQPEVIVLDVMLPNVDGWQLLMRLHEDQDTRSVPVIICTVIREKELALSLGASAYLAKPVRPREFIQALDRVLSRAPAAGLKAPGSNAESCSWAHRRPSSQEEHCSSGVGLQDPELR